MYNRLIMIEMKRITKSLFVVATIAIMICGFKSYNSSNEIVCSNIEALTDDEHVVFDEKPAYGRLSGSEMENVCRLPNGYCFDYDDCYGRKGTCIDIVVKP